MRHRKPVPLHGTPSVQATFCGHVRETYSLAFAERQKRGRQAVENSRKPSTHSTKFRHAIPFTVVRPLCLPLFPKKYPVVQSFCVLARWNPFFLPLFPVLSTSAFRSFGSFFPFSFRFFLFLFLFFFRPEIKFTSHPQVISIDYYEYYEDSFRLSFFFFTLDETNVETRTGE